VYKNKKIMPMLPYLKRSSNGRKKKITLKQVIAPNSEVVTTMKPKPIYCVFIVPNGPTPPPFQAIEVDATTSKLVGISNLTHHLKLLFLMCQSLITSKIPQIKTTIWLL
jgi:hypothetical protein